MKTKTFDCVEMKRRGAEALQEKLASLTQAEQLAWWQERTEQLRELKKQMRQRTTD
jgi:hypothetical protein